MSEATFSLGLILSVIWGAAMGAVLTSFILVVIRRGYSGRQWVWGRSTCDHCGQELTWRETVPVISFIWQGGRSRCCQQRLAKIYVLAEAGGALGGSVLLVWLQSHV